MSDTPRDAFATAVGTTDDKGGREDEEGDGSGEGGCETHGPPKRGAGPSRWRTSRTASRTSSRTSCKWLDHICVISSAACRRRDVEEAEVKRGGVAVMERASPASAAVPTTLEVCPAADAIVFSGEAPHRTERGEEEKGVPSRFAFAGPKIGFSSSFPLSPLFAFPQGEVAAGFGGCAFKNAVSAHDVQNEEARREEEEEEKEEEEEMEAFDDEERREGSTWTHTCGGAEEEPKGGAAVRSPQSGTGVAARCPSPRSSPVVCEEESSVEERQEVV